MTPTANDALLQETGRSTAAVLVHLRKLLRVRNRLRSPFLRLPIETIVRILSLIMDGLDSYVYSAVWTSIYGTCHRIHEIMCSATELWWKVDCTRERAAHFAFVRSGGNPRVIVSNFRSGDDEQVARSERILDHWRDGRKFRGNLLHTLEFSGTPSCFTHFSWIFERPLPRLGRLKVHITDSVDEDFEFNLQEFSIPEPVVLQLPTNMPLQVLDLRNVTIPWLAHRFTELRELHLNFRDCDCPVPIPEDELFGFFDASPQLERLSLVRVGHVVPIEAGILLPPKRVLQFPNLLFLKLENRPTVVKYTLSYMDLPVIASLEIRSLVRRDIARTLNHLFPNNRLPARLFPKPPRFAVDTVGDDAVDASIEIEIGGVKIRLDFSRGRGEFGRNAVMSCISQLVPPSVTALKLDCTELDEQGWRDFFTSHPEVRSIECTEFCGIPVSSSLWAALSPAGEGDTGVPCPRLESISIGSHTGKIGSTPLAECLRKRQTVGFKLGHLKIEDHARLMTCGYAEEFDPLVEVVEANKPNKFRQQVGLISTDELRVC